LAHAERNSPGRACRGTGERDLLDQTADTLGDTNGVGAGRVQQQKGRAIVDVADDVGGAQGLCDLLRDRTLDLRLFARRRRDRVRLGKTDGEEVAVAARAIRLHGEQAAEGFLAQHLTGSLHELLVPWSRFAASL